MSFNYYYTILNKHTGEKTDHVATNIKHCIVEDSISNDKILSIMIHLFLVEKRVERFNQLVSDFKGDITDKHALENYLPREYKRYAYDVDLLMYQMASIYEIHNNYEIQDVKLAPKCFGCLYDRPGQRDHMDPYTGCLLT